MKYIVFKTAGKIQRELPVIFPETLTHSDVAKALMETCPELKGASPISAGALPSLSFEGGCAERSLTLNLDSRKEQDDRLISMIDYTHGIVD